MRNRVLMVALATAGMTMGYATPAAAQATRTWVSGVGDDVNPCSRTAPCKTFAGAISKTAANGEINCLDPGGYGAVTITKSITIDCHYTEGGALAGGNGITVNDGATATPNTAVVVIRGLDIFGVNPPTNGVRFVAGAALHIEDSVIRRFNAANSFGVSFAPAASARLFIKNSRITQNGTTSSGGGILIQPTGTGVARVDIRNTEVQDNGRIGISIQMASTTGVGNNVSIDNSVVSGNPTGDGIVAVSAGTAVNVMVANSLVAHNALNGIIGSGGGVTVRVGNTTVTGNAFTQPASGVVAAGGALVQSYNDNRVNGNTVDGGFSSDIAKD
ncbi:MAG TPA: right-handed parallel beta-helix repeat-containing protein [Allosphingosinicella sp.]